MNRGRLAGSALFFSASFGLTLGVLAATNVDKPKPAEPLAPPAGPAVIETRHYTAASEAFGRRDLTETERLLLEAADRDPERAQEAKVVLGLFAHSAGEDALAVEQLQAADGYGGELEDWRLWSLGTSAEDLGLRDLAIRSYESLLSSLPASPLIGKAVVALVEAAAKISDWPAVLAFAELAEGRALDHGSREVVALRAWEAAQQLADEDRLADVARRLLVNHPLQATELDVADTLRQPDGSVDWAAFLTPDELVTRADGLTAVALPDSALDTLAEVAISDRTLAWTLAQAEALTSAKRGEEALAVLADAGSEADPRLEWARARAALEAATPRRDRRHSSSDDRAAFREQAKAHLERTVQLSSDRELSIRALRILFSEHLEADRFDDALGFLRRLQGIDPSDTTGARSLWRHGWTQYAQRNYSGAVGYWAELAELYGQSNYNRAGLYWSGRAHELLGNRERAQALYGLAANVDFTDIYRRHALRRLELAPEASEDEAVPSEPWPTDPSLARAERLHSLGLHDLALQELETLDAEARSRNALRARALAARGERRTSIMALRAAFPLLGTPHQNLAPLEARRLFYPLDYQEVIEKHSDIQRLPSHLVFGMIRQESAFDASAKSWAGARGLMQVMPATGRELARRMGLRYSTDRLSEPEFSVQLGTRYFKQVLAMFDGDEVLALAGYNAGPYRIKRLWRQAGSDPEIDQFLEQLTLEETKTYVKRVLLYSDSYRRLYDASS